MDKSLKLAFVGDVALNSVSLNPSKALQGLVDLESYGTTIVLNLESAMGHGRGEKKSGSPILAVSQEVLQKALDRLKNPIVCLANNHVADLGADQLMALIGMLDKKGFRHFGAGKDKKEAGKPLIVEDQFVLIPFLDKESDPYYATEDHPGACCLSPDDVSKLIREYTREGFKIIVYPHWGIEYFHLPRPKERRWAAQWVEDGADVVIGHHPHVVRGMECIRKSPVFYSLGNVIFGDILGSNQSIKVKQAPLNRIGLAVILDFTGDEGKECEIVSLKSNSIGVWIDTKKKAESRMIKLSKKFHVGNYQAYYQREERLFNWFGFRWHFRLRILNLDAFLRHFLDSKDLPQKAET